jgi:hypothetical protein
MMIATPLPVLRGSRLTLRRPVSADIDARLAIGRHAEIVRAYGRSFDATEPYTRQHAERTIGFLTDQPYAGVIDAAGFIGHVRFHTVDANDRRAGLAIGIEDPTRLGPPRSGPRAGKSGFGASCPLPCVSAKVASLNRQRTLNLGDGSLSSCPLPDLPRI